MPSTSHLPAEQTAAQIVQLPAHWPLWLVALVATVVLAGLDVAGAVAAKEWAEHRATLVLVVGLVLSVLLFVVYAASLQYASLTTVTFGWVVMLQVGVVLVDRFRYDERFPPGTWAAVVVLVAAQAYLLLAPSLAGRQP